MKNTSLFLLAMLLTGCEKSPDPAPVVVVQPARPPVDIPPLKKQFVSQQAVDLRKGWVEAQKMSIKRLEMAVGFSDTVPERTAAREELSKAKDELRKLEAELEKLEDEHKNGYYP
jgi:hypothetical protein